MSQWGESLTFQTTSGVGGTFTPKVEGPTWMQTQPTHIVTSLAPIHFHYPLDMPRGKQLEELERIRALVNTHIGKPYSEWLDRWNSARVVVGGPRMRHIRTRVFVLPEPEGT